MYKSKCYVRCVLRIDLMRMDRNKVDIAYRVSIELRRTHRSGTRSLFIFLHDFRSERRDSVSFADCDKQAFVENIYRAA